MGNKMMIDIFRKVLPIRIRQDLGLWLLRQTARSKVLLRPYFLFLCGTIPKNLELLPNGECYVKYHNKTIVSPRDGILAFVEVFQDKVYEKVWSPQKGDTVIDIGAYVGMFTVLASELVGKTGHVIAIEPSPSNFGYLSGNTHKLSNVDLIRAVVSSVGGTGKLYLSQASPCHTTAHPHKNAIKVRKVTLDSLNVKADFIKIDAEGSEIEILRGAEKTLLAGTRLSIASYHDLPEGGKELPVIVDFLEARDYKVIVKRKYVYAEPVKISKEI